MTIEKLYVCLGLMNLLVLVGVIMEGSEIGNEIRTTGWRPIAPKLGFIALVLGLSGEMIFQTFIESTDSEYRIQNEQKVEQLKHENLILEKQVSPRRLSLEQQKLIVTELTKYSDKKVLISSYALDAEAFGLSTQLLNVFKAANITIFDHRASIMSLGGFAMGIAVSGKDKDLDAVNSIVELLSSNGLGAFVSPKGQDTGPTMSTQNSAETEEPDITILVGLKPLK